MSFLDGWKLRHNGQYKKTTHYTITKTGKTNQHYSTEFYSDYVGIPDIDNESITIGLLNLGWIKHDVNKTKWVDWLGHDIDITPEELIKLNWRNHSYWYPYSKRQTNALIRLINQVCEEHQIEKVMIDNNTILVNKKEYWPISFRSNYLYYKTDVSPAFPFKDIVNKIG